MEEPVIVSDADIMSGVPCFHGTRVPFQNLIDYLEAIQAGLILVPSGSGYDALRTDYLHMVEDGLLAGDAETFEDLMGRCSGIQAQLKHR